MLKFKTLVAALILVSGFGAQAFADEPYFGAYLVDEKDNKNGALIEDVKAGSPAAKAGFKKGDMVLKWNDKKIANGHDLIAAITGSKAGAKVTLVASRGGWTKTVEMTLGSSNPEKASQKTAEKAASSDEPGFLGVYLKAGAEKGAIVDGTVKGSPARKAGLKRGDVIVKVNGTDIENPQGLINLLTNGKAGDVVKMKLMRDGWAKKLTVTLGKRPAPQQMKEAPAKPAEPKAGKRERGFLGIAIDGEDSAKLVIAEVQANSSADKAGLKAGDEIKTFDGVEIKNVGGLRKFMADKYAGDTIKVVIMRDGWARTVEVTLRPRDK